MSDRRLYGRAVEAVASFGVRRLAAVLVVSGAGIATTGQNEAVVTRVYRDPVGIPTVCGGHTGPDVPKVGTVVPDSFCERLTQADAARYSAAVGRWVKVPVTQQQFDQLVDFTWNVGEGNLQHSTLLRKLNAGDCHGAAAEFPKWNKAAGRVLPGLTARRAQERAWFEADCP
jgi:lysozyme